MSISSFHTKELRRLLLKKACGESLTTIEQSTLSGWTKSSEENERFLHQITTPDLLADQLSLIDKIDDKKIWADIQSAKIPYQDLSPVHRVHFLRTAWFRYAAAIILLAGGIATWYQLSRPSRLSFPQGISPASTGEDIAPGTNKAILTLADGSTIVLDNATNGKLAQQGNAAIVKLTNGQIAYNLKGIAEGEVMMNTMTTPRGGQYQLVLPDGSKIWLNAASSITYPAVFVDKERKVKITGEAYLEIAKNKSKPFIVDVDGKSLIEVLGTSFNVNSYADEATIKTTLVEGGVRVKVGDAASLLKPGQGAEVMQNTNTLKVIDNVNIDQTLAWKNGVFNLQNLSLQEFARQLERWYDIEVKYEGSIPDKSFKGEFSRDVRLSDILNWFSKLGIQNRLEGRTLILGTN